MVKRGDALRDHIAHAAKDVFLEMGFERASMDLISARAQTSKRTLIELVRGPFLDRLKMPGDGAGDGAEALVMFCGRFLRGAAVLALHSNVPSQHC